MEKSEIEHYLRDIWVREFEKEEKLVVDEFNQDDIIAGNITNNYRLPVNMIHSSKWKITPLSYGINYTSDIKSNSDMCILSYPNKKDTLEHGYYDVNVRYSLDRNVNYQYTKKAKLKIL